MAHRILVLDEAQSRALVRACDAALTTWSEQERSDEFESVRTLDAVTDILNQARHGGAEDVVNLGGYETLHELIKASDVTPPPAELAMQELQEADRDGKTVLTVIPELRELGLQLSLIAERDDIGRYKVTERIVNPDARSGESPWRDSFVKEFPHMRAAAEFIGEYRTDRQRDFEAVRDGIKDQIITRFDRGPAEPLIVDLGRGFKISYERQEREYGCPIVGTSTCDHDPRFYQPERFDSLDEAAERAAKSICVDRDYAAVKIALAERPTPVVTKDTRKALFAELQDIAKEATGDVAETIRVKDAGHLRLVPSTEMRRLPDSVSVAEDDLLENVEYRYTMQAEVSLTVPVVITAVDEEQAQEIFESSSRPDRLKAALVDAIQREDRVGVRVNSEVRVNGPAMADRDGLEQDERTGERPRVISGLETLSRSAAIHDQSDGRHQ